jgi:hypothetical protein
MRDLSSVVESLRRVQQARRRFLEMWKLEQDVINPMLDRMAEDLQAIMAAPAAADDDPFEPSNRDDDDDDDKTTI